MKVNKYIFFGFLNSLNNLMFVPDQATLYFQIESERR